MPRQLSFLIPLLLTTCLLAQSGSPAKPQSENPPAEGAASQPASKTESSSPPASSSAASTPDDSTKLEAIKIQKASYPDEAAQKGIQGQVWLKLLISESGDVKNVEVISGDPVLVKAAVDAAKKWKFKPFIRNGKPIEVSSRIPFDFAFRGKVSNIATPTVADNNKTAKRVQVAQGVSQGLLVHKVQPIYPETARQNRVQGTVLLQALIGKDGRIRELKPISGPGELVGAAVGAVQQWRYKPYILNNEPVEVDTQITVIFQLSP